jgi:hypothetical protein
MQKMQKEHIKAIEVREEPTDAFNEHVDTWMKKSVWMTECRSWYKMGTTDGKAWLWPGGVRIGERPTCSALTMSVDTLIPQDHQAATLRELFHKVQEPEPMGFVGGPLTMNENELTIPCS